MDKVDINIDGKSITADSGSTILAAANHAGIYIPTLCYHPDLKTCQRMRHVHRGNRGKIQKFVLGMQI